MHGVARRLLSAAVIAILALAPVPPRAQTTTTYTYDPAGRLTAVQDTEGEVDTRPVSYEYDRAGNRVRVGAGDGVQEIIPVDFCRSAYDALPTSCGLSIPAMADGRVSSPDTVIVAHDEATGTWISADLGTNTSIAVIDLAGAVLPGLNAANANHIRIQYSLNGHDWTTKVDGEADIVDNHYDRVAVGGLTARYWRILRTVPGPLALGEFRFFKSTAQGAASALAPRETPLLEATAGIPKAFAPFDWVVDGNPAYALSGFTRQTSKATIVEDPEVTGGLLYTPRISASGDDAFTFSVTDNSTPPRTISKQVQVRITAAAATSQVQLSPITLNASPNAAVRFSPLDFATGGGGARSVVNFSIPQKGSVARAADDPNVLVYTANPTATGPDQFSVTVGDSATPRSTATAFVTVTIASANQAPVANADATSTTVGTPVTIDALVNDVDGDDDPLSITLVTQPAGALHGAAGRDATNGRIIYTPPALFIGTEAFSYTVSDGRDGTATANVTVTVSPASSNHPPVPVTDNIFTAPGTAITFHPQANDTDPDADTLSVTGVTQPPPGNFGSVTRDPATGAITYRPWQFFAGEESFTYTVSDGHGGTAIGTVIASVTTPPGPNHAPSAHDDTVFTTPGSAVTFRPTQNDTDPDADALAIFSITQPPLSNFGSASFNAATGEMTYRPWQFFLGQETFTYTVVDGHGGTSTGTVSATVSSTAPPSSALAAAPLSLTVLQGTTTNIRPTLSVSGGAPPYRVSSYSQGGRGAVTQLADGLLAYAPAAGQLGQDSLTLTLQDSVQAQVSQTVSISIVGVGSNHAPTANPDYVLSAGVLRDIYPVANDMDADGDPLQLVSATSPAHGAATAYPSLGKVYYVPTPGYVGVDSFDYEVADDHGHTSTGTVTIALIASPGGAPSPNYAPYTQPDEVSTQAGVPVFIEPLLNDYELNNEPFRLVSVDPSALPGHTVVVSGSVVTYRPAPGFSGQDRLTYTVSDNWGAVNTGVIVVTVGANHPPVANPDSVYARPGIAKAFDPRLNDTDPDANAVSLVTPTSASHGTVTIDAGQLVYTAAAGYSGADSIAYTIVDVGGLTAAGTVAVTVQGNTAPVATADSVAAPQGGARTFDPRENDSDFDGDILTVTAITQPANGVATRATTGTSVTYTPVANYTGPDALTYTVSDGHGGTATATVALTVSADYVEYLVVGGGGGGAAGGGGGGGGGGVRIGGMVLAAGPHSIVVGGGGWGANDGVEENHLDGGGSAIDNLVVAHGGGSGAGTGAGRPGASGGGAGVQEHVFSNGGAGLSGEGYAGGRSGPGYRYGRGGGGGVGGLGQDGAYGAGGAGGPGVTSDISGSHITYGAGGGAGAAYIFDGSVVAGAGGDASAASGAGDNSANGSAATYDALPAPAGRGGGGGGGGRYRSDSGGVNTIGLGGAGGSGLVIIRYRGPPRSLGGTVAQAGGYTLHTFTSSAALNVRSNAAPVAVDDVKRAHTSTAKTFDPRQNDSDADGDPFLVMSLSAPAHGTAQIGGFGTLVTYTPLAGYTGADSFTYTVMDGQGGTSTATVSLTVLSNTAPTAANDAITVDAGVARTLDPRTNDGDADDDPLTITAVSTPSHGVATRAADGASVTYTATAGYYGSDSFSYTIADDRSATATATISVTVNPSAMADYLIVAGGGGGANGNGDQHGGGGGGGGLLQGSTFLGAGSHAVTVGAAGPAWPATPDRGGDSAIAGIGTAVGGGSGSQAGGSGGGGVSGYNPNWTDPGGAGTAGQGHSGGAGGAYGVYSSGGGGGAGGAGQPGTGAQGQGDQGGAGGAPITSSISGTNVPYAGGGNGAWRTPATVSGPGFGGAGGGLGSAGTAGIVVIRYPIGAITGLGGAVTTVGGYVVHTFTSNGTFSVGRPTVAVNDSATTDWLHPVSLDPRANDSDPDGDALTVTAVSQPSHGAASLGAGGASVTFAPTSGYAGPDSFTYTISDGHGGYASATVSVTVTAPPNTPPTAANDVLLARSGSTASLDPRWNDRDLEDALTVSSVGTPAHGTASVVNAGAAVSYTATAGYTGGDTFTYTVSDGRGGSASATVNVTVGPTDTGTNAAPVAVNDNVTANKNVTLTIVPQVNDTDANGDTLVVTGVTPPAHGALTIVSSGASVSYVPTAGYTGADGFTYSVSDGRGGTATATVTLNVITGVNLEYLIVAGGGGGGSAGNGGGAGGGGGGVLTGSTLLAAGSFPVTVGSGGAPDASGTNSSLGSQLVALGGGAARTAGGSGGGAHGASGASVGFAGAAGQGNRGGGALAWGGGGGGGAGAAGAASQDTHAGAGGAGLASEISGGPIVYGSGGGGGDSYDHSPAAGGPGAGNGSSSTGGGGWANRGGGGGGGGWAPGTGNGGSGGSGIVIIRYPIGAATFTGGAITTVGGFKVHTFTSSGTLAVSAVNSSPVAVADSVSTHWLATATLDPRTNDTDADGDALTVTGIGSAAHGGAVLSGNTITYTPVRGYIGTDSFSYAIADGRGGTNSGTVTVTVVDAPETAPVAANDSIQMSGNTSKTFDPRTNDSDAEQDPITVTGVGAPGHGTATVGAGGTSVTYTPTAGYAGSDSFTYTIADGRGGTATATVGATIAVPMNSWNPSNKASFITLSNANLTATRDTGTSHGVVRAIDSLSVGRSRYEVTLDLSQGGRPAMGVASPTGTFGSFLGADALGIALYGTGEVYGNGQVVATLPYTLATGDRVAVEIDATNRLIYFQKAGAVRSPGISFAFISGAVTPALDVYSGGDRATGNFGTDGWAVTPTTGFDPTVNLAPTPANDSALTSVGTATTLPVLANDSDPNGQALTITAVGAPAHGAAVLASGGASITYTPTAGYSGIDSFTYTVSDGLATASATVVVTVRAAVTAVTWSPSDKYTGLVLSNGNLTATRTGSDGNAYISGRANTSRSSGKYYFEVTAGSVGQMSVGLLTGAAPLWQLENSTTGISFYAHDRSIRSSGYLTPATSAVSAGTVIRVAVDLNAKLFWASPVNEPWNQSATASPATGTGGAGFSSVSGPVFPAYMINPFGPTWTLNAGATAFAGGLPRGFAPWDASAPAMIDVPPVAANDTTTGQVDRALAVSVLANDTDPDGDALTVSAVGSPAHGTAAIQAGTSVTYTPTTGYVGADSFTYTTSDGQGGTATATVNVTIAAGARVEYLVVGGGGGGGGYNSEAYPYSAGGGGGGGVIVGSGFLRPGSHSIVVGAGGLGGDRGLSRKSANGGASAIDTITALGGGYGGNAALAGAPGEGGPGGSGGGGAGGPTDDPRAGGAATPGQGNRGGQAASSLAPGGGGGYGSPGVDAYNMPSAGGSGLTSTFGGASTSYAGGGGASGIVPTNFPPGAAGDGSASAGGMTTVTAAPANRGGGGGGGDPGGTGGSGIVIIRYPTGAVTATGGTVTTSGGYTIHTFTSSGTFTVP